ncbi:executer 1, putative [Medicago truncatula]|uniref:Executer 1, putative n=2 Tax=Medicago truncatula TaxID=3880 RepID=G7JPT8_MEDTR|nr:executer 1, putative [Medicago truncatula]
MTVAHGVSFTAPKLRCFEAHSTTNPNKQSYKVLLHLQLAIDKEEYQEAARLKKAVDEKLSLMMPLLKFVGLEDSDDPFSRIIHISPGIDRFVAKSYTPRQLLKVLPGTPVFEIYVVKNADYTYQMQVVHLLRAKRNSMSSPPSKVENESSVEIQEHEEKVEKNDEVKSSIEEATKQGIKSVLYFLKDKIPGLQITTMNINAEVEGAEEDEFIIPPMLKDSNKTTSSENIEVKRKLIIWMYIMRGF